MYFILILRVYLCACVYYLHLIQLTDLSMSEGTDTMKIRVSDQWAAMLYFPLDKFTKVFTSHLHTVVTARQEGSSQTHDNDRQLTLTIMPPLLTLKRARPLSFHCEGMQRGRGGKKLSIGKEGGGRLASSQGKRQFFDLQTVCHHYGNPSATPFFGCQIEKHMRGLYKPGLCTHSRLVYMITLLVIDKQVPMEIN